MTTHQLEEAITNQYDNGRYSPLGADGGSMKYIRVIVDNKTYWADITLDHEIAKIRRVWALTERGMNNEVIKEVFNFKKTYYSIGN